MSSQTSMEPPVSGSAPEPRSRFGLEHHGLANLGSVHFNLDRQALIDRIIDRHEGTPVGEGVVLVDSGTSRAPSPGDRFLVREPHTDERIWWGERHRPISWSTFNLLLGRVEAYLQRREVFVQDCLVGPPGPDAIPLRVVTELAWHSLVARNLYFKPVDLQDLQRHIPDFTLLVIPGFQPDPRRDGTPGESCVAINLSQRLAIIAGTALPDEIRYAVMVAASYLLSDADVLPLEGLARIGPRGECDLHVGPENGGKEALAFTGPGPNMANDVFGWSAGGLSSLEAGHCTSLSQLPEGRRRNWLAGHTEAGTILINARLDGIAGPRGGSGAAITDETRVCLPPGSHGEDTGQTTLGQPRHLFLVTMDLSGVLPPIARLSTQQMVFHHLIGYTSRPAGADSTVFGEPPAVFQPCFGQPVLANHPYAYTRQLARLIDNQGVHCWLLNTGRSGGSYPNGRPVSIEVACVLRDAAASGEILKAGFDRDPVFGFEVPRSCPGVPPELLHPERAWPDPVLFERRRGALVARMKEQFHLLEAGCPPELAQAGPSITAG